MEGGALTGTCDFPGDGQLLDVDKGAQFHIEHFCHVLSGRNSAVECQLPKLDVTGSIPVARSNFSTFKSFQQFQSFKPFTLW
jgi:hypothetical protein